MKRTTFKVEIKSDLCRITAADVKRALNWMFGSMITSVELADENGNTIPICDACGDPISESQMNVGHECNLHEWRIEDSGSYEDYSEIDHG